jgi:hypothetical protein
MNLLAGAGESAGKPLGRRALVRAWADEEKGRLSAGELDLFTEFLGATWPFMKKALYVDDFVYNDSSQFPVSVERAWWSMADKHSLAEWDPRRTEDLELDPGKIEKFFAEKESAVAEARTWGDRFAGLRFPRPLAAYPGTVLPDLVRYLAGFDKTARVCLLAAWVDREKDASRLRAAKDLLGPAVDDLRAYTAELRTWHDGYLHRHQTYMIMNPDRAEALAAGGAARLKK